MLKEFNKKIMCMMVLLAMMVAAEMVIIGAWLISFIPATPSPLLKDLFERHRPLVVQEHDMLLYRLFLVLVVLMTGIIIVSVRRKSSLFLNLIKHMCYVQSVILGSVVWVYFKFLLYGTQRWPHVLLGSIILCSLIIKIFFPEVLTFIKKIKHKLSELKSHRAKSAIADGCVILLIASIVTVKDIQALLAKIFFTDHFHHLDTMLTSPAWGYWKGLILDVDIFSHYSLGVAIVTAWAMKLCGGFSYENVLMWMLWISVFYYFIFYKFVRTWLGSIVLATTATLLLMKWTLFHPGVTPVVFSYPSATVLRYPLDVLLLWIIYKQLINPQWKFLALGSFVCGFSLFYMIDSGVYLTFTWIYVVMFSTFEHFLSKTLNKKVIVGHSGALLLIFVTTFMLLFLAQGPWLFTSLFWTNFFERTSLFLMGHGNLLMTKSMMEGKFFEGIIGFLIPLVYIGALILPTLFVLSSKVKRDWLMVSFIALYGLASYHYYVCRSADTSYYVVCMPLVLILIFVIKQVMLFWPRKADAIGWGSLFFVLLCLLTTHQAMNYPNWWNMSFNPIVRPFVPLFLEGKISFMNHHQTIWNPQLKLETNSLGETNEMIVTEGDFKDDQQLKQFFAQEFDFTTDAQLIVSLTKPDERIALISSFETKILMQANRAPFFYYFPLVDSRGMRMRMFDMTALWTTQRLAKTMKQLIVDKPEFVFLEKVLLTPSVPQAYEFLYPDLLVILRYLNEHYESIKFGKYLVALKLKR